MTDRTPDAAPPPLPAAATPPELPPLAAVAPAAVGHPAAGYPISGHRASSGLPAAASPSTTAGPGLTPEHFRQLAEARRNGAKVRRAIGVATFDAWATVLLAWLTLLAAPFSGAAAVVGVGMAVVAFNGLRGLARLRKLDLSAPRALGLNQLLLAALLLGYAAYSLWSLYRDPGVLGRAIISSPELAEALGLDLPHLVRVIGWSVYGGVAAVAIFGQGGAALYYFTRRKYVERYARETPQWILDAQRAGMPM